MKMEISVPEVNEIFNEIPAATPETSKSCLADKFQARRNLSGTYL